MGEFVLPLPFEDRVALVHAHLALRYERRGSFLSDDDLLDAAELFTVDMREGGDWVNGHADYDALVARLFVDVLAGG